jgi:hypothetical protein
MIEAAIIDKEAFTPDDRHVWLYPHSSAYEPIPCAAEATGPDCGPWCAGRRAVAGCGPGCATTSSPWIPSPAAHGSDGLEVTDALEVPQPATA